MRTLRLPALAILLTVPAFAYAQGAADGGNLVQMLLLGAVVALILVVVVMTANSFLNLEARATGAAKTGESFTVLPSRDEVFGRDTPRDVSEDHYHKLRQGFDVNLLGEPAATVEEKPVSTFAVQPPNFIGISPIPKVVVEVGQSVLAGEELFYDKKDPDLKYVAPVSGEVIEVNRAEKRAISEVVILADKEQRSVQHADVPDLGSASRQQLVDFMLAAGVWPMLRQRPYNVTADRTDVPKSIFVSTFDTAPLAPDLNLAVNGRDRAFQRGLDALGRLTPGPVVLGLRGGDAPVAPAYANATGVERHYFDGPHPAGNVGVHIHHVDPVGPDQVVWTAGVQDVITIGQLFLDGRYDASRVVALSGAEFERPRHVRTYLGAKVADLVRGELADADHQVRLISGDVLSGVQKTPAQYLNFYDDQVTSIEEGNYFELFGWLLPIDPRPSRSGTFPNKLFGNDYKFRGTTNSHGEKRAFVVTGEYEAVLPMDVLPQHLMKAIMVNDFERMEGLGIYELVEEDVALCEFACTSKQPLQRILRQGLDVMREQG